MRNSKSKVCHIVSVDMTIKFLLLNQLKFLQSKDYKVSAICSYGKWIKDIEQEGIKVKIINFKRKISPFSDLICLFQLFFYFKKEKFTLVHTHTPKPGLLGQLAAKFASVPIIINTIHGFYFNENTSFLKRKFFIFIEKTAAKYSDFIFSQNKEDIKTAIKEKICPSHKIKFLGNSVDLQKFNSDRFSEEFIIQKKKELKIQSQKNIIGIVGRLVKEKGYLELFQALKIVLEKFPNSLLLVIGPIEKEKKDRFEPGIIKNFGIEKNVLFLGEREDVDEIYPLMDIFVLPSYREGFPHSIIEASAMRRPVVATDVRGCREAVEDGKTGILVPVRNPEKLAQAIIYLLNNPEIAQKMGENGRRKAEREFDEKIIFGRIKTEYQQLIKEKLG